jgi:uncharacterized protein YggE
MFRSRAIVVLSVALLVALPSLASAQQIDPSSAAQDTEGISVLGQGSVAAAPGAARVTLGVEVFDASLANAQAQAAQRMDAVISALRAAGIPDSDIRTTSVNVSPQYDNSQNNQSVLRGYQVQNLVEARSDRVDALGTLIDNAIAAGATRVNGIAFEPGDLSAMQAQARTQALQDARTKAEQVARDSGLSLGRIVRIETYDVGTPPPIPLARPEAAQRATTPIEPGQLTIRSTVRVVWQIQGA